jgi:release factor glutamine methyltransferase
VTTIDAALAEARRCLPAIEARLLLRHLLGWDNARLAAHGDDDLDAAIETQLRQLVGRRVAGEPVAYLIGVREFYGRDFTVSPDVLIPRPETELLVELSLRKLAGRARPRILELATGSGCIAVTLTCEMKSADIVAVDISPAALTVAEANARQHGARVEFRESDWFAAVDGRFDLIVANPPYIAAYDPHLSRGDLRFEPRQALASGADGLDAIRAIVASTPRFLAAQGWLLIEHGFDQAAAVAALYRAMGATAIEHFRDLAGLDRVSCAQIPASR